MDFSLWILVSWMHIMCGSLWSFCVSSSMPGRLELMHPAFQVISFNCDILWLFVFVVLGSVWVLCGGGM